MRTGLLRLHYLPQLLHLLPVDNCDVYFTNDPQIDVINQKSTWSIGLAFIVFFVGMLVPSIYLITSTLERLGEVEDEPELARHLSEMHRIQSSDASPSRDC